MPPDIHITMPDDSNNCTKQTEKLSKYKDMEIKSAGCGKWGQKLCQL